MAVPEGLGEAGSGLWRDLNEGFGIGPGSHHLALEACRCADRLDELDNVIGGKGVLHLLRFRTRTEDDDERRIEVIFDDVLAEARQQQMTLKQILQVLGVGKLGEKKSEKGGTGLDEFTAALRAKRGPGAAASS